MRLRDHDKGDLALTALTLTVAAVAAAGEVLRRNGRRRPGPATPHSRPRGPSA